MKENIGQILSIVAVIISSIIAIIKTWKQKKVEEKVNGEAIDEKI